MARYWGRATRGGIGGEDEFERQKKMLELAFMRQAYKQALGQQRESMEPPDPTPTLPDEVNPETSTDAADLLRRNRIASGRGEPLLSRAQRDAIMRRRKILANDERRKKQRAAIQARVGGLKSGPDKLQPSFKAGPSPDADWGSSSA